MNHGTFKSSASSLGCVKVFTLKKQESSLWAPLCHLRFSVTGPPIRPQERGGGVRRPDQTESDRIPFRLITRPSQSLRRGRRRSGRSPPPRGAGGGAESRTFMERFIKRISTVVLKASHLSVFTIPGFYGVDLGHDPSSQCGGGAPTHRQLPDKR